MYSATGACALSCGLYLGLCTLSYRAFLSYLTHSLRYHFSLTDPLHLRLYLSLYKTHLFIAFYIQSHGPRTPLTRNHLCATHPQIAETLHQLQNIHQKLGYFNTKFDPGDPIPTTMVPSEFVEFMKSYMVGSGRKYVMDSQMMAKESMAYVNSLTLLGDGKDARVFDVDETLRSSLPFFEGHQYA